MMATEMRNTNLDDSIGNLWRNLEIFFQRDSNSSIVAEPKYYVLISIIVVLLGITYVQFLYSSRRKLCEKVSLHRVLPRVKWTSFNLSWLDGFITVAKLKSDGMHVFDHLAEKYGQMFTGSFGIQQFIVVSDPNVIKILLQSTNIGHLNKHKFFSDLIFPGVLRNGLAIMDQKNWSGHRKSISRVFSYTSFPKYLAIMESGAQSFVSSACLQAASNGGYMDNQLMNVLLEHLLTTVTAESIMGPETSGISAAEREDFYNAFKMAKEVVVYRLLHPELFIPFVWMFHNKKRELDAALITMSKMASKVIKFARENGRVSNNMSQSHSSDAKPFECLIEVMIYAGHTDSEIENQVIHFLFVGFETTMTALNFLIFHLAGNTVHQRKCQMEVDGVMDGIGTETGTLTMEHLIEMKYLERCILESLRLAPAFPALIRPLDTPLEIDSNSIIEAGQSVLVLPWSVHRNPEIYPNPDVFDPDRFLPENVKERHSHAFIPFSMGPRNCIGWKLALMELKVVVAHILRHFDLTTTDGPNDVKILFDITLTPERRYNISFKLRRH